MKAKTVLLTLLFGIHLTSAQLFVDFCNQTSPLQSGYQAYRATTTQPATFTSQSYSAFGTTVSITPVWDIPTASASIRLIDRGTGNTGNVGDRAPLLQDWLGTDQRTSAGHAGSNPMTLSISNLPAGTYRWLSYHHDPNDQTGVFDAYIIDAKGTNGPFAIDISNGNIALSSVTTWITTITSDGINPVRFRFVGPATFTITAQSFFLINGFELSFLGNASEWVATGGGNWSDAANWDSFGVPNGNNSLAIFGDSILAPSTVAVNIPVTLAGLNLSSTQSYSLAGASAITFSGDLGIVVDSGSHTISAPLNVSGGGALNLSGNGQLALLGNNTYSGATLVRVPVLSIGSMANGGVTSSIGASTSDGANLSFSGTLRYVGSGHSSDRLFSLSTGTRTLDASGTGPLNLTNPGELVLSGTGTRTLVLAGTNTGNNTLTAVLRNENANATALTKNGPGRWVIAGANTFTGPVNVNQGTLAVAAGGSLGSGLSITVQSNAVLDVSAAGLSLNFGQALQGSGAVLGNVTDGGSSIINPGGSNSVGTLTFSNSLTIGAGGAIRMDLGSTPTVGSGVNDLIQVAGNVDLSFATVQVNFIGSSLGGTYRLINYSGTLVGTPNVTVQGLENTAYTATVNTSTAGQVNLVISGTPPAITWLGDGVLNEWNLMSANWTNPATASVVSYRDLDKVTFNSLGSANSNVSLTAILKPGSVTVNAATDYAFLSTGRLSGAMSLVKLGSGSLTLSNANDYSGLTTVSGGILRVGNNTALGTSAGDTIVESGATLDVFGFQTSSDHIYVGGTGAGGMGAIVNTRAEQQSATRMVTLTADTLVSSDFRWDVRGAGGSGSLSGIFDLGGFTFTRMGTNRIAIVDAVATNAGNIVMVQGGMSLTRSIIDGPGHIDVGTNFVWIENSTTGRIAKPFIFAGGRLQCSGGDFVLESFITNIAGLILDAANTLTISNQISGAGSLTKIAAGTAVLEAANTYAGNTAIGAGTLRLGTNGTIGGGSAITMLAGATFDVLSQGGFTVASGKTMTAAGTINGALTIAPNATLQVGSVTNTGVLIVTNGTATLGGTTLMKLAAGVSSDAIRSSNSIALGGTLIVSILSGSPAAGQVYKLFDSPLLTGSFTSVTLPPLGPGMIWINNLTSNGTLTVGELELVATVIPGGFLQFTWDPVLNGLVKLQAQTNSLNVGLGTNWSDYPGGTFNGTIHIPSQSSPSVFFRLSTQ